MAEAKPIVTNTYRYTVELQYINGGTPKTINPLCVKSMIIDYDYDRNNMPLIFMTLSLDKNILDDMIINANKALINLTVYKYISNSTVQNVKTIYIREQCVYFISDDINFRKEIDEMDKDLTQNENLYKITTIGLMKLANINNNKKSFNSVIKGITMVNLIYNCTNHMPMLIEALDYNKSIAQVIFPPINSVSMALKYLNENVCAFYKTSYRFFMDFDATYLLSSAGKPVIKKGEQSACNAVSIDIKAAIADESKIQGMYTDGKQKIYRITVNSLDTTMNINKQTEKSFKNIAASTAREPSSTNINVNNSGYINSKTHLVRLANDNTGLLANLKSDAENSSIILDINKNDIDSSVITMNKEYIVKSYNVYKNSDGRYLLSRKRELYLREDDGFIMNTMITLRKIIS